MSTRLIISTQQEVSDILSWIVFFGMWSALAFICLVTFCWNFCRVQPLFETIQVPLLLGMGALSSSGQGEVHSLISSDELHSLISPGEVRSSLSRDEVHSLFSSDEVHSQFSSGEVRSSFGMCEVHCSFGICR